MEAVGNYRIDQRLDEGVPSFTAFAIAGGDARPVRLRRSRCTTPLDVRPVRLRELEGLRALGPRPGGATLLDFGLTADGHVYVVQPLEPSRRLTEVLDEGGRLDVAIVARIFAELAGALADAHSRAPSVVHGALHPEALRVGADGRASVDGFVVYYDSLVCEGRSAMLDELAPYLSPEHVAPEQMVEPSRAGAPTTASDVFSLGSWLFEALTGAPAFRQGSPLGTRLAIGMVQKPSLDDVEERAPELAALLRVMWERDPARRPAMHEVQSALQRHAAPAADVHRRFAAKEPEAPKAPSIPAPARTVAPERAQPPVEDPTFPMMEVPNHLPERVTLPPSENIASGVARSSMRFPDTTEPDASPGSIPQYDEPVGQDTELDASYQDAILAAQIRLAAANGPATDEGTTHARPSTIHTAPMIALPAVARPDAAPHASGEESSSSHTPRSSKIASALSSNAFYVAIAIAALGSIVMVALVAVWIAS